MHYKSILGAFLSLLEHSMPDTDEYDPECPHADVVAFVKGCISEIEEWDEFELCPDCGAAWDLEGVPLHG